MSGTAVVESSGACYLTGHGETLEAKEADLRRRGYLPLGEAAVARRLPQRWDPPRLTQADYDFLEGCAVRVPAEPAWPLTVHFDQEDVILLPRSTDAETELEFFDSDDPDDPVLVLDALARPVHLVVDALQLITCSLKW
jgi:hypothetical protein